LKENELQLHYSAIFAAGFFAQTPQELPALEQCLHLLQFLQTVQLDFPVHVPADKNVDVLKNSVHAITSILIGKPFRLFEKVSCQSITIICAANKSKRKFSHNEYFIVGVATYKKNIFPAIAFGK
jgi:hypothetical protein